MANGRGHPNGQFPPRTRKTATTDTASGPGGVQCIKMPKQALDSLRTQSREYLAQLEKSILSPTLDTSGLMSRGTRQSKQVCWFRDQHRDNLVKLQNKYRRNFGLDLTSMDAIKQEENFERLVHRLLPFESVKGVSRLPDLAAGTGPRKSRYNSNRRVALALRPTLTSHNSRQGSSSRRNSPLIIDNRSTSLFKDFRCSRPGYGKFKVEDWLLQRFEEE